MKHMFAAFIAAAAIVSGAIPASEANAALASCAVAPEPITSVRMSQLPSRRKVLRTMLRIYRGLLDEMERRRFDRTWIRSA